MNGPGVVALVAIAGALVAWLLLRADAALDELAAARRQRRALDAIGRAAARAANPQEDTRV